MTDIIETVTVTISGKGDSHHSLKEMAGSGPRGSCSAPSMTCGHRPCRGQYTCVRSGSPVPHDPFLTARQTWNVCCFARTAGESGPMARARRVTTAGIVQHVMNRGNRRVTIFRQPADYEAFIALLLEAGRKFKVKLLAFCLMPNHWHLVLVAQEDGAISLYMRWLTGTHVRRYHKLYRLEGTGHLYQERYTSVLVQSDRHLLAVLCYVESNARRAGLVSCAQNWPWSSLGVPDALRAELIAEGPVARPSDWLERTNRPVRDLAKIRECVLRGRPFGSNAWTEHAAVRHGLQYTIRSRGRPRKTSPGTAPRTAQAPSAEAARAKVNPTSGPTGTSTKR